MVLAATITPQSHSCRVGHSVQRASHALEALERGLDEKGEGCAGVPPCNVGRLRRGIPCAQYSASRLQHFQSEVQAPKDAGQDPDFYNEVCLVRRSRSWDAAEAELQRDEGQCHESKLHSSQMVET